jgi:hypothetical protein
MVTGYIALPPNQLDQIGKVDFAIVDLYGKIQNIYPGQIETFSQDGTFQRAKAQWPSDEATPGAHQLLGLIYDHSGHELGRVAPRMVSVNMKPGY